VDEAWAPDPRELQSRKARRGVDRNTKARSQAWHIKPQSKGADDSEVPRIPGVHRRIDQNLNISRSWKNKGLKPAPPAGQGKADSRGLFRTLSGAFRQRKTTSSWTAFSFPMPSPAPGERARRPPPLWGQAATTAKQLGPALGLRLVSENPITNSESAAPLQKRRQLVQMRFPNLDWV